MLTRIVSGGQTGVDRGALDAALAAKFPCGGWCPEKRKAEDGVIPDYYPVTALRGAGYKQRTRKNVQDSDGTVILSEGALEGGTKRTRIYCVNENKPFLLVDATEISVADAIVAVVQFVAAHKIMVLNVAGPRASGWADGHRFATDVIGGVITEVTRSA